MRMSSRLRRLEQAAGGRDPGCPACRDRRGFMVLVTAHRLPDGGIIHPEGEPAPCEQCGVVPEFLIEVIHTLVDTREDLTRIEAEERASLSQPNPPYRGATRP